MTRDRIVVGGGIEAGGLLTEATCPYSWVNIAISRHIKWSQNNWRSA